MTEDHNTPLPYDTFCTYVGMYGFINCPLTREQYQEAIANGAKAGCLYGMACDMNAGVEFATAMKINIQR